MIRFSLTKQVVGSKWVGPGLISGPDGSLHKAFVGSLIESGAFETDFDGPNSAIFFSKLSDLLSRLPDAFEGQLLLQRKKSGNGLLTKIFGFERVRQAQAYSHLEALFEELDGRFDPLDRWDWRALIGWMLACQDGDSLPDLNWGRNHVSANEQSIRVVSLTELPQVSWQGCLQPLIEHPTEFTLSIRFKLPSREATRRRFEAKRRMSHALSIASSVELQNIESNSVLSSSQEILERLVVGKEALFDISLALICAGPDLETKAALDEIVKLGTGIGNSGFFQEGIGCLPVLKSHIPGNQAMRIRTLPILSGNLAEILPLIHDYSRIHDSSALELLARSGEQSNFNLFSEANLNFNGLVCGASGSGKSFLMNAVISAGLKDEPGMKLCIFDVGGSYKKLVSEKGGICRSLSKSDAESLLAAFLASFPGISTGVYPALLEILCGAGSHITHSHRVALKDLLEGTVGQKISFTRIVKAAAPRKEQFYQDIAHWLKPYMHLDCLPIDEEMMRLPGEQLVAFDFKNLSNEPVLERAAILILTELLWKDLATGKYPRTLIVFDEVWRFFKAVKEFIEEMYRTLRKYRAGIVSITQNIADYGDDEFAKMVFTNSNSKVFLEGGASKRFLESGLDLTESDALRANSVASKKALYSEFFVSSGEMSQVMRLYPDQRFYDLANTEKLSF
jgi:hypothetical protein